jgi:hypothetical protein
LLQGAPTAIGALDHVHDVPHRPRAVKVAAAPPLHFVDHRRRQDHQPFHHALECCIRDVGQLPFALRHGVNRWIQASAASTSSGTTTGATSGGASGATSSGATGSGGANSSVALPGFVWVVADENEHRASYWGTKHSRHVVLLQ